MPAFIAGAVSMWAVFMLFPDVPRWSAYGIWFIGGATVAVCEIGKGRS